jgi:hypothetical protein
MSFGLFRPVLAVIIFCVPALVFSAESTSQDFEHQLQLRDNTIIELLERVEALEQRVGLPRQDVAEPAAQEAESDNAHDIAQPPGAVVIKEGEAERALERSLTREGALLLPSGVLEIEPGFSYARREDSSPGFVTIGSDILASKIERNSDSETTSLTMRLGLPWDSQFELGIPYQRRRLELTTSVAFAPIEASSQSDKSTGDLRIGFAKTVLREGLWQPDLVARVTVDTDSGNTGGFEETRLSISATKRQNPITFIGAFSYEQTESAGGIKPGSTTGLSFGSYIAISPETSLSFVFAGSQQKETRLSGMSIAGSSRDSASLVIGGSSLLAPGTLLHLSTSFGLSDDADDFAIALSLPIRLDARLF